MMSVITNTMNSWSLHSGRAGDTVNMSNKHTVRWDDTMQKTEDGKGVRYSGWGEFNWYMYPVVR